ncbi:MAG: folylpolyglutamate synthase/dihydrofolate synthase family protein [Robiginitomaculum sp.]|nr:folylpolyglutamate synthase/dihydrofolate synthase family protein [Robiginitomaculum sp.]MDQ7076707.1 folylpolyglutamate synthase/dihydrofolate synthase family protein [Robiginitomaculum sp.]
MSAARRITQALGRFDALHPADIDLGLDRIRALLKRLGDPHQNLPPVVHVAGTNGKGSTIAMLGAMAKAANLRAHIHTSPHLIALNERYVIAGAPITDAALADLLEEVERVNDSTPITQFEMLCAAMFLAFARTPADIVLIEVGLGGEFDASNVLENPALCLITPIAHDHANFLGDDMAGIARAKAGIIKPGAPVYSAAQNDIARNVIERAAARARAPLHLLGEDMHVRTEDGRLIYEDDHQLLDLPLPRLLGAHQVHNAGLAIAAALHLGWDHDAIAEGLETVNWPGRLQILYSDNGAQMIVDGAHNPHAARALAKTLGEIQHRDPRPLTLIIGLQNTKDAVRFFEAFKPLDPGVICVPVPNAPHPMSVGDMQTAAKAAGLDAHTAPDVQSALQMALHTEKEPRIVMSGSLYLVGAILAHNS